MKWRPSLLSSNDKWISSCVDFGTWLWLYIIFLKLEGLYLQGHKLLLLWAWCKLWPAPPFLKKNNLLMGTLLKYAARKGHLLNLWQYTVYWNFFSPSSGKSCLQLSLGQTHLYLNRNRCLERQLPWNQHNNVVFHSCLNFFQSYLCFLSQNVLLLLYVVSVSLVFQTIFCYVYAYFSVGWNHLLYSTTSHLPLFVHLMLETLFQLLIWFMFVMIYSNPWKKSWKFDFQ